MKQISEAFQASDDKVNFLIDGVDVNNVGLLKIIFLNFLDHLFFHLYDSSTYLDWVLLGKIVGDAV